MKNNSSLLELVGIGYLGVAVIGSAFPILVLLLTLGYTQPMSRLSQLASVTRFDDGEHSEGEMLAHVFIDLEV